MQPLIQSQDDNAAPHVLVKGKSSMTADEFQLMLDAAPRIVLTQGEIPEPNVIAPCTPSKGSGKDLHG